MPLYFFNLHNGRSIFDPIGTELADVREMRLHMLARATASIQADERQSPLWAMEALDERGDIVGALEFGMLGENNLI